MVGTVPCNSMHGNVMKLLCENMAPWKRVELHATLEALLNSQKMVIQIIGTLKH